MNKFNFVFTGGETIKQINQQTGAHCELDRRDQSNENEKLFIIRGNPEQVEHAKRIFSEKLGMVDILTNDQSFQFISFDLTNVLLLCSAIPCMNSRDKPALRSPVDRVRSVTILTGMRVLVIKLGLINSNPETLVSIFSSSIIFLGASKKFVL